ncbi:hypothetical protein C8R45DRAFT_799855, partial [Mycena sanguinolenta]
WPKLNWGLILSCGLAKFLSPRGTPIPAKNRFFTILLSTSLQLIRHLRNERLFETHASASRTEIHSRWVSAVNCALKRDIILTNKARFGSLALNKQLFLKTWSGALSDERN